MGFNGIFWENAHKIIHKSFKPKPMQFKIHYTLILKDFFENQKKY
jgi:hypothetical protein